MESIPNSENFCRFYTENSAYQASSNQIKSPDSDVAQVKNEDVDRYIDNAIPIGNQAEYIQTSSCQDRQLTVVDPDNILCKTSEAETVIEYGKSKLPRELELRFCMAKEISTILASISALGAVLALVSCVHLVFVGMRAVGDMSGHVVDTVAHATLDKFIMYCLIAAGILAATAIFFALTAAGFKGLESLCEPSLTSYSESNLLPNTMPSVMNDSVEKDEKLKTLSSDVTMTEQGINNIADDKTEGQLDAVRAEHQDVHGQLFKVDTPETIQSTPDIDSDEVKKMIEAKNLEIENEQSVI